MHSYRISRLAFFLSPLLVLIAFSAPVGAPYSIGPIPEWALQRSDYHSIKQELFADSIGKCYLLLDRQANLSRQHYFQHFAYKVISPAGLQAATTITIAFDPAYNRVILHSVKIYSGRSVREILPGAEIKVIQREDRSEWNIYDGRKSIIIFLKGLKIGDIVDYSFSLIGDNPIFDGKFCASYDVGWSDPVQKSYIRLLVPRDRKISIRNFGTEIAPVISDQGAVREYAWTTTDLNPVYSEGETPSWYDEYPYIQVSEFATWREVVGWALPQFDEVNSFSPEQLKTITGDTADTAEQIRRALRFVQNEIRYLGIEAGINSHKPHDPLTTLRNRFGDCKDKTYVLLDILRSLGIEAYPAFVNTDYLHTTAEFLPSPLDFDHVIVYARLHQRDYWLDPTLAHQEGKLDFLGIPDYRTALVIREGDSALTPIVDIPEKSAIAITEAFMVPSYNDTVSLRITTTYTGREADFIRDYFEENRIGAIQMEYVNFYARRYPGIFVRDTVDFRESKDSNTIIVSESYGIRDFWDQQSDTGNYAAEFACPEIGERLTKPEIPLRHTPFELPYPNNFTKTVTIELPEPFKMSALASQVENSFFVVSFEAGENKRTVRLNWNLRTKSDAVPADSIVRYIKDVDRIGESLSYYLAQRKNAAESISILQKANAAISYAVLAAIVAALFLIPQWVRRREELGPLDEFTYVSIPRLIVYNLATFGIYQLYWFYLAWRQYEHATGQRVRPLVRSIFSPVFAFILFPFVKNTVEKTDEVSWNGTILAGLLLLLSVLPFVDPTGPILLLGFITFFPLIPVQASINRYLLAKYPGCEPDSRLGSGWIFAIAAGLIAFGISAAAEIVSLSQ